LFSALCIVFQNRRIAAHSSHEQEMKNSQIIFRHQDSP